MKTILIVDGICPRGLAMVRYLSSTGEYHILIFTTDTTCAGAKAASALPSVTLLLNRATSGYDLQTFLAAAQRCPSVLICSNSTNSEGKEGVQWGARLVQTAASASVNHLVFLTMDQERKQYSTDSKRLRYLRPLYVDADRAGRLHPLSKQIFNGMDDYPLSRKRRILISVF